jgi:hypothetical protein
MTKRILTLALVTLFWSAAVVVCNTGWSQAEDVAERVVLYADGEAQG